MKDPKIVIHEALGWEPEIISREFAGDGLVVIGFRSPTNADLAGQIVMSEGADAAVIQMDEGEEYVLSPLDGPKDFSLEVVVSITDAESWRDAMKGGAQEATAALFGDVPEGHGIRWGTAKFKRDGNVALITLPVSVTDRAKAAAYVRESRSAMWGDDWIPGSMRELAFEATIGSSDAPGPDHFGFETTHEEEWKNPSPTTAAIANATDILADTLAADCWSLDEVAEGGIVKVYANDPTWRSTLITVSDRGVETFPVAKAVGMMKDRGVERGMEP